MSAPVPSGRSNMVKPKPNLATDSPIDQIAEREQIHRPRQQHHRKREKSDETKEKIVHRQNPKTEEKTDRIKPTPPPTNAKTLDHKSPKAPAVSRRSITPSIYSKIESEAAAKESLVESAGRSDLSSELSSGPRFALRIPPPLAKNVEEKKKNDSFNRLESFNSPPKSVPVFQPPQPKLLSLPTKTPATTDVSTPKQLKLPSIRMTNETEKLRSTSVNPTTLSESSPYRKLRLFPIPVLDRTMPTSTSSGSSVTLDSKSERLKSMSVDVSKIVKDHIDANRGYEKFGPPCSPSPIAIPWHEAPPYEEKSDREGAEVHPTSERSEISIPKRRWCRCWKRRKRSIARRKRKKRTSRRTLIVVAIIVITVVVVAICIGMGIHAYYKEKAEQKIKSK